MIRSLVIQQIAKVALWSVALVVLVSLTSVYFSAWLPWYLLPDSKNVAWSIDYSSGYSQTLRRGPYFHDIHDQELSGLPTARYVAYSIDADGQTLVVTPSVTAYRSTSSQLERQGWVVESVGLTLRARKLAPGVTVNHDLLLPSLTKAVGKTLQRLFHHPSQAFPLAIAAVRQGGIPEADSNYYLLAFIRQGDVVGVLQRGEEVGDSALPAVLGGLHDSDLKISLPSSILTRIPTSQLNVWESKLWSAFGFLKTHPSFIEALKRQKMFTLKLSGDSAVLGVVGQSDVFRDSVNKWLTEEDSYHRPRNQAFRLPDGGLGYEVVPGKARTILSSVDGSGCQEYIGEGHKVWLCIDGDAATLSTNQQDALLIAQEHASKYYMAVNESTLRLLGIIDLKNMIVKEEESGLVFTFDF